MVELSEFKLAGSCRSRVLTERTNRESRSAAVGSHLLPKMQHWRLRLVPTDEQNHDIWQPQWTPELRIS